MANERREAKSKIRALGDDNHRQKQCRHQRNAAKARPDDSEAKSCGENKQRTRPTQPASRIDEAASPNVPYMAGGWPGAVMVGWRRNERQRRNGLSFYRLGVTK